MKAIQIEAPGGPEVLRLIELATPEPGHGQVRVRAEATGVGKPDVMIRKGIYPWMPPLPTIPGNEMVGCIDALGPGVTSLRLGQRVFVSSREMARRGGCYAEFICVPRESVFVLPDAVRAEDAACLGNYQLALALLFDSGIRPPESMLVHGAAGGVATALVQVGTVSGIRVFGVASTRKKCDFARAQGAQQVFLRGSDNLVEAVMECTNQRGVDLVLDPVGGPAFSANLDLLAPRGTLLSYATLAGLPGDDLLAELRRRLDRSLAVRCYSIHTLDLEPDTRRALMQRAIQMLAQGQLRPPPPQVFKLGDAPAAHRHLDQGLALGKIVLVP